MSLVTRNRAMAMIASTSIGLMACGEIARAPSNPQKPRQQTPFEQVHITPEATPEAVQLSVSTGQSGAMPNIGGGPIFSNAGAFSLTNTSPGSATFTLAPVADFLNGNAVVSVGTGGWSSIVAGGNTFSDSTAETFAGVLPDDLGTDYLLLAGYTEETDPATGATIGTVMYAIVLASDFAVGSSVNLDGTDRLAIFARGDINLPDPEIAAAAVTGTISFSAGGLNIGDLITANLTGDFGEFTWSSTPPPPPGGGNLTPGNYTLVYDPMPYVSCDGTLIGQEAQFAAITAASVGFTDGPVTLANGANPGDFDISGAPISSAYGVPTLTLEPLADAPPGLVGNFVNGTGAGPAGTTVYGTYLVLDGDTATPTHAYASAGVGYMNAAQDGFCSVDFAADMGP